MSDEEPTTEAFSLRRSSRANKAQSAKASALDRLKAIKSGASRRVTYDIKLDAPIYDTVDEDQYKSLVARRRDEFRDFIVAGEDGVVSEDYVDDGEEEDWTKAHGPLSLSSEEEEGEEGKRKKGRAVKEKKEKTDEDRERERKARLMAAAVDTKRINAMFTSAAVFRKRGGEERERCKLGSDSVVEDVLAEFAADDSDRERRRRRAVSSKSSTSGLGIGSRSKVDHVAPRKVDYGRDYNNSSYKANLSDFGGNDVEKEGNGEVRGDEGVLAMDVENGGDDYVSGEKVEERVDEVRSEVVEVKEEKEKGKGFVLNARIKDEKDKGVAFSASVELQAMRGVELENGNGNGKVESGGGGNGLEAEGKVEFVVEKDGSVPFYILDAYEEAFGGNAGTVYLFGKVKVGNGYKSCCVVVKNMLRCVYAIPNESVFNNEDVLKLEKDAAESKISAADFRTKLHEIASGLKREMAQCLLDLNVSTFSMAPVKRNYAFERSDIPVGENYVLKVNYPFKDPPLPSDVKGQNFCAVVGTHSSALESFLIKRKIKGPSWLSISKFTIAPNPWVSWCKFEIIVDSPKKIQVSPSTKHTAEIPPVIVTAINLKTVINEKQNNNEIVSASIISCSKTKIDIPMTASEWKRPGTLSHFTVVRLLEVPPMGFKTEVDKRNSRAGSIVLASETNERALLSRLMQEIYKIDSDVLVGHNISGFDLDVLFQRAHLLLKPVMWSKMGRLKRKATPKMTRGSAVFGSGASPGIMSCIAGRLLCDTFLCSRDLLKEVSYSLTQLAKTQLNKERKEINAHDIPKMYQTAESLFTLIECNETDAWLSMELMFHLSILPLTRQLTNISGNLWGKTLQGARAQRVEYLLLHAFHAKKYIVPDKYSFHAKESKVTKRKKDGDEIVVDDHKVESETPDEVSRKGKKGPAYAGGLVLEPKKGLYDKYVLLLDFNSLYPSIIQEYNICFTTAERNADGSVPRLPSCEKMGVLPELLKNLVERRRMVKSWLKSATGLKAQQFDIQQQALKLTANSMYGCLGFSNSRFYAKPLAELITSQGREILQSTVDLVQNVLNLEVIYGDTDSIMIYSGLDDIAKAKAMAGKVIQEVNKKYRCLEIDLDGLYKRMLLLKKKKYAAVKLQFRDDKPYEVIERKGLDMVRRDWSLLAKELGDFCLSQILSGGSCEDVVESIHNSLMKVQEEMMRGEVALEKYIITKSLTKPPEAYPDAKNQPHVQVALRLKQNGYSAGCSSGDTVPYIICCEQGATSGTSSGIAQRARHPDELNKDNSNWMIDIDYYLSQQIHPVVSRLCASIQGTDPARLANCLGLDASKFQSKSIDVIGSDPSSSLLCSVNDDERYQGCEPLILSCPSCSSTFDCPSVFSSICKSFNEMSNEVQPESKADIWQRLRCPTCPEEGDLGRISPVMIANQVKRQADGFISVYYKGLMMCEDETCRYSTRSLNLRVIGDSGKGTVCPNYPRCNGRLLRKYSEVDLYKQLTYFCHVLDTLRCLDKVDHNAKLSLEKELARVRPMVDTAAKVAQNLRDRCAYGWVQLNDLFVAV